MSNTLKNQAMQLLSNLTYCEPIDAFPDYDSIRTLPQEKFLITTGFTKLQLSKIHQLSIKNDFSGIYVVDPIKNNKTKRNVFSDIMQSNRYSPKEVLVVGDDPESELKAARELNIDAVLYDSLHLNKQNPDLPWITDFNNLINYLI